MPRVMRRRHHGASERTVAAERRPVLTLSTLLAMLIAMAVAVAMALYLPVWASLSITFGAVLSVAVGGPALLAKVATAASVLALGAWAWRRQASRRKDAKGTRETKLVAIPEPHSAGRRARPKHQTEERRAA